MLHISGFKPSLGNAFDQRFVFTRVRYLQENDFCSLKIISKFMDYLDFAVVDIVELNSVAGIHFMFNKCRPSYTQRPSTTHFAIRVSTKCFVSRMKNIVTQQQAWNLISISDFARITIFDRKKMCKFGDRITKQKLEVSV